MIRALYRDWARAPISGTLILFGQVATGILLWRGQIDRALLVLILCHLWIVQRGPYRG